MSSPAKQFLIQAISSDIGHHLAVHWRGQGHLVRGTYRTMNHQVTNLVGSGIEIAHCDLPERTSIDAAAEWSAGKPGWDVLVLAAGTLNPVGLFTETSIDEWEESLYDNFVGQARFLSRVLPGRNLSSGTPPVVLMFAGADTNSAPTRYSAYTISKLACMKMCELLDAEINDTIFTILGASWVDTRIHQSTLLSPDDAGEHYLKTVEMLDHHRCTPMSRVIDCCDWIINAERKLISGRNFSLGSDPWDTEMIHEVSQNYDNFKLRRFGNDLVSSRN